MAAKIKQQSEEGKRSRVTVLDISNNKLGDRVGIVLLEVLLKASAVSKLGLSRTGLGYKWGVWMLRVLRSETGYFALRHMVMNYNAGISVQQKKQIAMLLEERELESMGNLADCDERED